MVVGHILSAVKDQRGEEGCSLNPEEIRDCTVETAGWKLFRSLIKRLGVRNQRESRENMNKIGRLLAVWST